MKDSHTGNNEVVIGVAVRVYAEGINGEIFVRGFTSGEAYRKAKALADGIENPRFEMTLVYDQPRKSRVTVRRTEYLVKDQSDCPTLA